MSSEITIITGRKGTGKSTLAHHFARLARAGVVVFDPNGQFGIGKVICSPLELSHALDTFPRVVFQPQGDVWDGFQDFKDVIWERRNFAVIVDEVSLLGSAQRIHPALDQLIRLGRTKELDIFLTAHRPQDLHGICFSLADSYCFFHTTHPRDLQRIEDFTSAELAARVQTLRPHEFVRWSVATEGFYVNAKPEGWREEISPKPAGNLVRMEAVNG